MVSQGQDVMSTIDGGSPDAYATRRLTMEGVSRMRTIVCLFYTVCFVLSVQGCRTRQDAGSNVAPVRAIDRMVAIENLVITEASLQFEVLPVVKTTLLGL